MNLLDAPVTQLFRALPEPDTLCHEDSLRGPDWDERAAARTSRCLQALEDFLQAPAAPPGDVGKAYPFLGVWPR